MTYLQLSIAALVILAAMAFVSVTLTAPYGHQDANGFHDDGEIDWESGL